ncbi:MAG: hypothetical protein NVS1B6_12210 [Steroidobacteraceae bacterium]
MESLMRKEGFLNGSRSRLRESLHPIDIDAPAARRLKTSGPHGSRALNYSHTFF